MLVKPQFILQTSIRRMIADWKPYLAIHSYFDASYAFSAAISLHLAQTMRSFAYPDLDGFLFTDDDQSALDTVLRILRLQSSSGNIPAKDFEKRLRLLENNLSALQTALDKHVCLDELHFELDYLDIGMPSSAGNIDESLHVSL
jgi:hypothetical protein